MFVARSKTVGDAAAQRTTGYSPSQSIDSPSHHVGGGDDDDLTLECFLQTLLGLLQHGAADVCVDLLETMLNRQTLICMPLSSGDAPELRQKLLEAGALLIHGPSRAAIMPHPPEDMENPNSEEEEPAKDMPKLSMLQAFRSQVQQNPFLPPVSESDGLLRRLFLLLDEPELSLLGRFMTVVLNLFILISIVTFVLESMPSFRKRPQACAERLAAGLPLTLEVCEPHPNESFQTVETVCLSVFTMEYVFRILSAHAGSSTLCEGMRRTLSYALQPLMLVDLLAILPSYLRMGLKSSNGSQLGIVRLLRMLRILRLFKLAKYSQGVRLFGEVLRLSGQPLLILVFFNVIIMLVFGSLIHFAEGQQYSVAAEFLEHHPTGVFVRTDPLNGLQPTPFRSIPYSIWWVCITMTTVGYGDYAPTTSLGKLIGVACFYIGVLFLALPVNILGSNFELVYGRYLNERREANPSDKRRRKSAGAVTRRMSSMSSASYVELPWLPQCHGFRRGVFFFFEHPTCCKLGKAVSALVMGTIVLATVSFIMESMPAFRTTPLECKVLLAVQNCEPQPWPVFMTLEKVAVAIFTVDYVCRILSVHAVSPAECNINNRYGNSAVCLTWRYFWQWMNLIDVLAIIPFYLELLNLGMSGGGSSVLRVFRLVRVFRMLKMPKVSGAVNMFANVVADSLPALFTLFFMTLMGCVFFASLVTFAEGSTYSVEHFKEDYPEGVYVRPTADGYDVEISPFLSVLHAFWWFFVTANTVGYGDLYPTTTLGRLVGVITSYVGILLIALPITIVGGNFSNHYDEWVRSMDLESSPNQQSCANSQGLAEPHSNVQPADPEAVEAPKDAPDASSCKSVLTNSCTLFSGGTSPAKGVTWTLSNGNGDTQSGCQKI